MTNPVSLSDDQLAAIERYAKPLAPADRSRFLVEAAVALASTAVVGDGTIGRVCAKLQKQYAGRAIGVDRHKNGKRYPPKYSRPSQNGGRKRQEG